MELLNSYFKRIHEKQTRGDAREESHYEDLSYLLSEYARTTDRKNTHITTLPKQTEAGNPDFRVWDGNIHITGYIEAKTPETVDLDNVEKSSQLKRYRNTFPNLILTNFFEFRLYRDGQIIDKVEAASPLLFSLKSRPVAEEKKARALNELFEKFFSFSIPKIQTAQRLAEELATRTRFLRDEVVTHQLIEEQKLEKGDVYGTFKAFKEYLIRGLSLTEFADLYAQTVTYGLFAARTRARGRFSRKAAFDNIPQTIGILRDIFRFVSLGDVPPQMEWIIDDISEVLSVTDVPELLHKFYHEGKGKDPIVHFYETFLSVYDPETREKRGVYYTPEPVVSYIAHSLNEILKTRFHKTGGFAGGDVTVLDPAAGTLTFLAETTRIAFREFESRYGAGGAHDFIKEHILKNFFAFEVMMAPYAIGHIKMAFLLEELGYQLGDGERFNLYLTNTLEMDELPQTEFPIISSLSRESHLASQVKKDRPILVILGNPPYSGHSANPSEKSVTESRSTVAGIRTTRKKIKTWIGDLIEDYKFVDGTPLGDKNPKWLQNDYVKFIRFAQWKIDRLGEGVLGFITDHSYLDGATFRGMRRSLMESFNDIYILNLHGNTKKKEASPDGSKDENVFDIQQGTAILICVKDKKKANKIHGKVHFAEIWGDRQSKYDWLSSNAVSSTKWETLTPAAEQYLFIPMRKDHLKKYESFISLNDIFVNNSVGIVTARDNLTIHFTPEEIWSVVLNFSKLAPELARSAYGLGKDASDWKIEWAQKDIRDSGTNKIKVVPILYRPFDNRYTYYTGHSTGFHCRPRRNIMRYMLKIENRALLVPKRIESNAPWSNVFCTEFIADHVAVSLKTIDYVFPLYYYSDNNGNDLFNQRGNELQVHSNIKEEITGKLGEIYKKTITPEHVFAYIYAILHSVNYRTTYHESLRLDFPRIPFTSDGGLFLKAAKLGEKLTALHLMKPTVTSRAVVKMQGKGNRNVQGIRYDEKNKRLNINETLYFDGVDTDIWNYCVGGYQVCAKWLKDRKGRELSLNEIKHFCNMAAAIKETMTIQKQIDNIFIEIKEKTISFNSW